jgi:ribA/ribD-fused uncharacterized protein
LTSMIALSADWIAWGSISLRKGCLITFLERTAKDEKYGCFSNAYHESGEGHIGLDETLEKDASNNVRFWCVNQELHYRKAKIFGDDEIAQQILGEKSDAGKIKQFGRMVKGYDDAKWTELRYDVARNAVYAKFSQDDTLKKILEIRLYSRLLVTKRGVLDVQSSQPMKRKVPNTKRQVAGTLGRSFGRVKTC